MRNFRCVATRSRTIKIPSKLEVAPPPKCGLGEWVTPLRLLRLLLRLLRLRLLEHLAVLIMSHHLLLNCGKALLLSSDPPFMSVKKEIVNRKPQFLESF